MTAFGRREILALILSGTAMTRAAAAAPRRYRLDANGSTVGFRFTLNGAPVAGTMPVSQADIRIDPADLGASKVDVRLDAARARTGLAFATQAMTGPQVLAVAAFPTIRFVSARVRLGPGGRLSEGASIDGQLTLRGVTRPISLAANLYRARGSAPDDLSRLSVRLTGRISRSAFGASGFPDLVGDEVTLDILAVIRAE